MSTTQRNALTLTGLAHGQPMIGPAVVGDYVHERLAGSTLVAMNATGHCPNLSAPAETVAAIRVFL